MPNTAELTIRSGGMVAVIAADQVSWFAALDAMREHLLAEHADLLTTSDRQDLTKASGPSGGGP